jgi:hypothetical protein
MKFHSTKLVIHDGDGTFLMKTNSFCVKYVLNGTCKKPHPENRLNFNPQILHHGVNNREDL